jgi:hypothetical protein
VIVNLIRAAMVLTAVAVCVIVPAQPGSAAEAVGCSGEATSYTASGALLDGASAPGAGATEEFPFVIDMDGRVTWAGSTDAVIQNGTYTVTVAGIPVSSGDVGNEEGLRASQGDYSLSELPDVVSILLGSLGEAKIPVTATVTGSGGTCTASGYITGMGSPFASPLFYSAIFFLLIALLMLLWMITLTT